eukprot:scaffold4413_cov20-Tisochrysis_lutea.AAC.4
MHGGAGTQYQSAQAWHAQAALLNLNSNSSSVLCFYLQELVDCNIQRTTDFEWISRMRMYWRDDVFVEMVQACIPYGYEYLGNTPRLVITPLTDRCYMTLMSAMHLNLGGAPAGPAGTGVFACVRVRACVGFVPFVTLGQVCNPTLTQHAHMHLVQS